MVAAASARTTSVALLPVLLLLLSSTSAAHSPTYIGFDAADPTRGTIRFSVSRVPTTGVQLTSAQQAAAPQWLRTDRSSPLFATGYTEMMPSATGFRFRNTQTKSEVGCHFSAHKPQAPAHAQQQEQQQLKGERTTSHTVEVACAPQFPRFKASTIPLPPSFWTPTAGSFQSSTGWFQYPNYAYNLGGYWGCAALQGGHCQSPTGPFAANPGAGFGHGR
jgi:hypothetical protein